mgnify:CR=1 FL=1
MALCCQRRSGVKHIHTHRALRQQMIRPATLGDPEYRDGLGAALDIDLDRGEFSTLDALNGWETYATPASRSASADDPSCHFG